MNIVTDALRHECSIGTYEIDRKHDSKKQQKTSAAQHCDQPSLQDVSFCGKSLTKDKSEIASNCAIVWLTCASTSRPFTEKDILFCRH